MYPLLGEFFATARERQSILHKRRREEPPPWTNDAVFQGFRFCNVRREDDKTTAWFRDNIRGPLSGSPGVVLATVAFRFFNRIETGEVIKDLLLELKGRQRLGLADRVEQRVRPLVGKQPIVTGAYCIVTPQGTDKLTGVVQCIRDAQRMLAESADGGPTLLQRIRDSGRLEDAYYLLRKLPYLGTFTAYEVVTDLRHTNVLNTAVDIDSWAAPGPGAARGLARVLGWDPLTAFRYSSRRDRDVMLGHMLNILRISHKDPLQWSGPLWEMREVEHWLCEFDKYERGRLGERLKRKFNGGPQSTREADLNLDTDVQG